MNFLPRIFRFAITGAIAAVVFTALEGMCFLFMDGRIHEGAKVDLIKVEIMAALLVTPCFVLLGAISPRRLAAPMRSVGIALLLFMLLLIRFLPMREESDLHFGIWLGVAVIVAIGAGLVHKFLLRTNKRAFRAAYLTWGIAHSIITWGYNIDSSQNLLVDHLDAGPERPPSVVMVVIDTLRADHLGAYGYARPTSPVMDQIASDGTLFRNAWSQAPWTRPATASLMTGLYPSSHQSNNQGQAIRRTLPMISTVLRQRGYRTAGFSANPQVSPLFGFDRGFDVFWNVDTYSLSHYLAFGRCFTYLRNRFHWDRTIARLLNRGSDAAAPALGRGDDNPPMQRPGTDAAAVNQRVFRWIDDVAQESAVFLYVHYIDPHDPYDPPQDYLNKRSINRRAAHEIVVPAMQQDPYPYFSFPEPDADRLQDVLDLYDAEIRYVDTHLGKLIGQLQERGVLTDRDYLIVTSDHGEEFYDHGQWLHGRSLFEEMLHVPLIIKGPGVLNQVVNQPVQLIDIFPTLAVATGKALLAENFQGQELNGVLTGTSELPERAIFAERPSPTWHLSAMRLADTKLIHSSNQGQKLWLQYDLSTDPAEKSDLSAGLEPAVLGDQLQRLAEIAASRRVKSGAPEVRLDTRAYKALQQLGYLDPTTGPEAEQDIKPNPLSKQPPPPVPDKN